MYKILAALTICACALAIGACSASIGGSTISKDEVATKAQTALSKSTGSTFPKVTCREDLDVKKGATEDCSADNPGEGPLTVKATMSSVKGSHYRLDFQVSKAGA